MKIAIMIIAVLFCFLILANPKITFSPFSFELRSWMYAVGFLLILTGIAFIRYDSEKKGREKGINQTIEYIQEVIDEKNEPK